MPPDLTESSHKLGPAEDFDDEEDENDVQNNYLTQAELFRSYTEQNRLFVNLASTAYWFEYGGKRMGKMNVDPINLERLRLKQAGQVMQYDDSDPRKLYGELHKWTPLGKYKYNFQGHFAQIFISPEQGYYLCGSNGNQSEAA